MATKEDTKWRSKRAWQIFHFRSRFEMSEDARKCRKGVLEYCRDFVNASSGDEAAKCLQQLALLSPGDPLRRLQLHGLFRQLVAYAGNQSYDYRGYLLNERFEPATDHLIGKWFGLAVDQVRPMLKELASVGLIERVPFELNGGARMEDEEPKKAAGAAKKAARRNRAKISGDDGKTRRPSKKNGKKKVQRNKNGEGRQLMSSAQKGQREAETTPTPPTTPPSEPKEAEVSGGLDTCPRRVSPGSVKHGNLATAARQVYAKIDPGCLDFALEVYRALRIPDGEMTREGRREIGNFEKAWIEARAKLPPPMLADLRSSAVGEAVKIGKNCSRYDKPGAVWRKIFNQQLEKRKAKSSGLARTDVV